jgi:hypothetical protein
MGQTERGPFNLLEPYHRAKTLRRRLIAVAGQLIRTARQWGLKLATGWRTSSGCPRLAALGP